MVKAEERKMMDQNAEALSMVYNIPFAAEMCKCKGLQLALVEGVTFV